jgi:hypothetical protein
VAQHPGVLYADREDVPPRTLPIALDTMFVVQAAAKGPLLRVDANGDPAGLPSLADFVSAHGGRVTRSQAAYDSIDLATQIGVSRTFFSRLIGPAAVQAFKVLNDASAAPTLKYVANDYDKGNDLQVEIVGAGPFTLNVYDTTSATPTVAVETFAGMTTRTGAISATANGVYGKLTATGASTLIPAALTKTSLAGGTDDSANAGATDWLAAVNRFPRNLGSGQLITPGLTDVTVQGQIDAAAWSRNRVYIPDAPATTDVNALGTYLAAYRALGGVAGHELPVWPPMICDGVVPGTTRVVPASAIQAGLEARRDQQGLPPNQPAAGDYGVVTGYVQSLALAPLADTDWATLSEAGLNVFIREFGDIKQTGNETPADPTNFPLRGKFGGARLRMGVKARLGVVASHYVQKLLDVGGVELKKAAAEGVQALKVWTDAGAMGNLIIDTGPTVNPQSELDAGRMKIRATYYDASVAKTVTVETIVTKNEGVA